MKIETVAVHAGHEVDPATGAVAAPIYLSTTFERDIAGTYSRGFMYSRNDNPNRKTLERGVSMLEGGEAAAAFASGTSAAMSILQALSPGDHVLAHADVYYGTSRLIREIFVRWGLEADFVDMSDLAAVKKALRPNTKLAWAETPSNPLLKVVDLGALPSPFDCWLVLRGMRTLPWRMRAHSENAMKVAEFLARHPKVARVHYPGLQSHPGHKIAAGQMSA